MKFIKLISRIAVGSVFIFSGLVKAIDPLGSAYKFHDYFIAFGLDFLDPLALPLGMLLCTAEFIVGFAVLTRLRIRWGIAGVLILMIIFTPLTLILALTNPVSDCGCFGEAIHLTNWQTFWKNIVLLFFTLILFFTRKSYTDLLSTRAGWLITAMFTILFVLFNLFNLKYLPVADFMPYNAGAHLPSKMIIPEGVAVDEYETTFIYEKDGQQKEFTLDNYPADDTTWVFVDQVSVLVKKGYQPPVHDFSISTPEGYDITDNVLSDNGYSLIMISKKLEEALPSRLEEGFMTGRYCIDNGISFYILTASAKSDLVNYGSDLPFHLTDETTLKTIVRANPGYILLRGGTIIGKWSWASLPEKEWFTGDPAGKQIEKLGTRNSLYIIIIVSLSALILLMLIVPALKKEERSKK